MGHAGGGPAPVSGFDGPRPKDHNALSAPVAQLDRVLPSEGRGHRFESCRARHSNQSIPVGLPPLGGPPHSPALSRNIARPQSRCDRDRVLNIQALKLAALGERDRTPVRATSVALRRGSGRLDASRVPLPQSARRRCRLRACAVAGAQARERFLDPSTDLPSDRPTAVEPNDCWTATPTESKKAAEGRSQPRIPAPLSGDAYGTLALRPEAASIDPRAPIALATPPLIPAQRRPDRSPLDDPNASQ